MNGSRLLSAPWWCVCVLVLSCAARGEVFRLDVDPALGLDPAGGGEVPEVGGRGFGAAGTSWWSLGAGVAFSDDSTDVQVPWTVHWFIGDGFEFDLSVSGWYFAQDGDDAAGGNVAIAFRWHFVRESWWSVYGEAGIGLLGTTDDVPTDGTSFNFTPRAGVGVTAELFETGARLDVGVRWHHISNATTDGSDDNPARDGVMVYAGVMFPF